MKSSAWLMLVSSVSGDNKTARMRIWRALKASGAGALRDGVYLLPNTPAARILFEEQAQKVIAARGSAQILAVDAEDNAQQRSFLALFDRSSDYAELFDRLEKVRNAAARLDEIEMRRHIAVLRRDVAALVAIDFFPGAPRRQVDHALAELVSAFNARVAPDEPHAVRGVVPRRDPARFRRRLWATRERPWVDRIASAWLIRRFIDPQARFVWLKKPKDLPKTAHGFDFDGAEFSHIGRRVTFEVLAATFGLEHDPAIAWLGRLVHYLDVGGVPVPEAAGFAAILGGARARQPNDDKLLQSMSVVLDALYASQQDNPGGSK
jgi:hypothetical protein